MVKINHVLVASSDYHMRYRFAAKFIAVKAILELVNHRLQLTMFHISVWVNHASADWLAHSRGWIIKSVKSSN